MRKRLIEIFEENQQEIADEMAIGASMYGVMADQIIREWETGQLETPVMQPETDIIELKIAKNTLPKDGQKIMWQTGIDVNANEWKQGVFCEGDNFFLYDENQKDGTYHNWDESWDVVKWKPMKK